MNDVNFIVIIVMIANRCFIGRREFILAVCESIYVRYIVTGGIFYFVVVGVYYELVYVKIEIDNTYMLANRSDDEGRFYSMDAGFF